jgi:hypothetical protein
MGFRGSDDQRHLTPLQRQIIDAERSRRATAQQERQQEMMNQQPGGHGPSRPLNSRGPAGNGGSTRQSETVRYVNTSENPDHEAP